MVFFVKNLNKAVSRSNLLQQFSEMNYLACLIVVLHLFETTVEERFVDATVRLSSNMNLECKYPNTASITQISWIKRNTSHKRTIAVFHPIHGIHIEDKYKDRVCFVNAFSKDMSLNFIKTNETDMGLYVCSVSFPGGIWEKVIQVIQSDAFEVPVTANDHVVTEPGKNVTFKCPYSDGALVQQVIWERIKANQMDTIVLCNLSKEKSFGSDYQKHAVTDCATQESNILVIQNVTTSDSGIYRCQYSIAPSGYKTHVINLTVTSATLDHHWNVLLIAGGAAASLLLLVVILIISIVAVHRRKKKRKRRIMMALSKALHSTQTRPSNSYGRSNFHGTPDITREVSSGKQNDEIYINYRDVSRKPKMRT